MPHLVIQYTPNIEPQADMAGLCRRLAALLSGFTDENGAKPFPIGGVRVLAYPATHFAVADGSGDHAFVYLNLRLARGRSAAVLERAGQALTDAAKGHLQALLDTRPLGLSLQIDEGDAVFDAKVGNLHALFRR